MRWTLVRGISLEGVLKARPPKLVVERARKSHWLVTVFDGYDGRSAIEATREPSASKRGCAGWKSLDEKEEAIGHRAQGRRVPDPIYA